MTRITLFLSVTSSTMTASQISDLLEMEPDQAVVKGSDRSPPKLVPKSHGWHIDTMYDHYVDLDIAVNSLISRLGDNIHNMSLLSDHNEIIGVSLKIAIAPRDERIPLFFSKNTMHLISRIGASFDIEFFDE